MSDIQRYEATSVWNIEKNDLGSYFDYEDHIARIALLETELAEAKKDQARYQWLKSIDAAKWISLHQLCY